MIILERLLNRSQETNASKVQFVSFSYNLRRYNTAYVIILRKYFHRKKEEIYLQRI